MNSTIFITCSICITIFIFGVSTNAKVIQILLNGKAEKTSFNILCILKAALNAIIVIFGLPLTFFNVLLGEPLISESWDTICFMFSLNFTICNNLCNVLTAFNRFCAIYFPTKYDNYFNNSRTIYLIIIILIIAHIKIIYDSYNYLDLQCYFEFNLEHLYWFLPDHCSQVSSYLLIVYEIMKFNDSAIWRFTTGIIAWVVIYGFDGVIMIIFIKKLIRRLENPSNIVKVSHIHSIKSGSDH
ncbi:unnamed protein product [Caenorhabditis angaria]|uniref:G-protein coupled receptors family 1 profile domain-containing protein n=1 Tax=Caenorhabditis angaria TaxID=860376 RepID=A0A9P1N1D6_9PELO|nr:unnamed protein product [Caenorhabditis angaria]